MSNLTKRTVLTQLYKEFHKEITDLIDINISSIFPDHDLIDIVDIVYLISFYFGATTQYENIVKELLMINKIVVNDDVFQKMLPIIETFLNKFKTI
jgi:hypothetical protein